MTIDSEKFADAHVAYDHLHNSDVKRRVAYISSVDCIQKCDSLPKAKGRVVCC